MKKFLAMLLALTMLLAMAACGSGTTNKEKDEPETTKPREGLEDRWEWTVEVDGEKMQVEDFDGSFEMTMCFTFEDGKYTFAIDKDALEDSLEDFEKDLISYMEEMMYESGTAEGMSREEMDQQMQTAMGMSVAEFAASTVEEMDLTGTMLAAAKDETGTYKVEGNQLTMTEDEAEEECGMTESVVYTFKLDGDTLELTGEDADLEQLLEMIGEDHVTLKRAD